MVKLLITGANGFIGRNAAKYWRTNKPKTELLLTDLIENKKLDIASLDLRDESETQAYLISNNPTHIIHLAGAIGRLSLHELIQSNVICTNNLFSAICQSNIRNNVKIIQASSAAIYGVPEKKNTAVCEDHNKNPQTFYGISKLTQLNISNYYFNNFGINIINACIFNTIGPNQKPGLVPMDFISQIQKIDDRKYNQISVGNLSTYRDFIDVRDISSAFDKIFQKGKSGEMYNVGSGIPVKIEAIINALREITKVDFITKEIDNKPSFVNKIYANTEKINNHTSWIPKLDLEKSLSDMWNSVKKV